MNKIDIIQRLLDERHITAKEALVLMEKEIQYIYTERTTWPWPIYGGTGDYVPQIPYTTCSDMVINQN